MNPPPQHRPATSPWCRPGHQLAPNRRRAVAEPPSLREPITMSAPARLLGGARAEPPAVPPPALRDAYGSRTRGVEDLALLVAQALDVAFVFRDSYDHGEHYDYHGPGGEQIEIKQNAEDDDGELMEPAHPQYRSFVYVTQSPRAQAIAQALARIGDVELVRCELIDQD